MELFARSNLATVRDVEKASGLIFFPSLSREAKLRLLARTVLASDLLVDPLPEIPDDQQHFHNSANHLDTLVEFVLLWKLLLLAAVVKFFHEFV